MAYVYLISDYDEHGAENLVATVHREHVPAMFEAWLNGPATKSCTDLSGRPGAAEERAAWLAAFRAEAMANLVLALQETDEALAERGGWSLSRGWGGPVLQVVLLQDRP